MILKTSTLVLTLCVTWVNFVCGAPYSNVYVQSGPEVLPVEYFQYGSPSFPVVGEQYAQLSAAPVGSNLVPVSAVPVSSVSSYISPCGSSCFYPGQGVAPISHAYAPANLVAYNSPVSSVPIVVPREDTGYQYSYIVYDEHTGDHKAQREHSDGSVVRGEYSLVQPDGYVREVQYVADDLNGFNAIVKNYLPASVGEVKVVEHIEKKIPVPCIEVKNEPFVEVQEIIEPDTHEPVIELIIDSHHSTQAHHIPSEEVNDEHSVEPHHSHHSDIDVTEIHHSHTNEEHHDHSEETQHSHPDEHHIEVVEIVDCAHGHVHHSHAEESHNAHLEESLHAHSNEKDTESSEEQDGVDENESKEEHHGHSEQHHEHNQGAHHGNTENQEGEHHDHSEGHEEKGAHMHSDVHKNVEEKHHIHIEEHEGAHDGHSESHHEPIERAHHSHTEVILIEEDNHPEHTEKAGHGESNTQVSYEKVIDCVQTAVDEAKEASSVHKPDTSLPTYIILNKPC